MEKKRRYLSLWVPLLLSVVIYSLGDVLLKQGNTDIGSTIHRLLEGSFWVAIILSAPILFAFALTFASKLVMGVVLSKNDLGVSEGLFLALSVGTLFIMGVIFFAESATPFQLAGLMMLIVGIILVSDREDTVLELKDPDYNGEE
ncbi:MAG: hypothetical protein ACFFF4_15440 [Candidatus Thorarchaeota archaeon]